MTTAGMMAWGVIAATLVAACAPARREPPETEPREGRAPAPSGGGETVAGYIGADGRVVADTLAPGARDTARVERETVYAGEIAPQPRAEAEPAASGPWRVQVHASRDEAAAASVARRLEGRVDALVRIDRSGEWYRVRAGSFVERGDAAAFRDRLIELGFDGAFVVRDAPAE